MKSQLLKENSSLRYLIGGRPIGTLLNSSAAASFWKLYETIMIYLILIKFFVKSKSKGSSAQTKVNTRLIHWYTFEQMLLDN